MCLLSVSLLISIAIFSSFCTFLSLFVGRAQASLIMTCLNMCLLICLAKIEELKFVLFIFLLRGGLGNSNYPVNKSILMDYVSPENRGKWLALETLSSSVWSASALFGGFISDRNGNDYRKIFSYSASLYGLAIFIYFPLVFLMKLPKKGTEQNLLI